MVNDNNKGKSTTNSKQQTARAETDLILVTETGQLYDPWR
jgi:hypothetical protein